MGNSILNRQPNVPQGLTNSMNPQIMQQFNQFRRNFNGNPQQTVLNLLQQGTMSNQQFQQLSEMANQFRNFMK